MSRAAMPPRRIAVAVSVILGLALVGCGGGGAVNIDPDPGKPFLLDGVSNLTEIAQLTGPGAMNDTDSVSVAGTDLGSMVNVGDKTFFFFGDTFGEREPGSIGGQGGFWRSNVAAWTTDDDPSNGIEFEGWVEDEIGLAAPSSKVLMTRTAPVARSRRSRPTASPSETRSTSRTCRCAPGAIQEPGIRTTPPLSSRGMTARHGARSTAWSGRETRTSCSSRRPR